MVPMELGIILYASKKESGSFSLKSAFAAQTSVPIWKIFVFAFLLVGLAGLLSMTVAPLENKILAPLRRTVLGNLPVGFDWQNI